MSPNPRNVLDESNKGCYHLGHLILDAFKRNPDDICTIDAATGEKETNASTLLRSVRLARCLRRAGFQPGDVLALAGKNHIDLHIPFYAALMTGLPVSAIDPTFKNDEMKALLKLIQPRIIFCDNEYRNNIHRAIQELEFDTRIVTFRESVCTMEEFIRIYEDKDENGEEFSPVEFDGNKIYSWLVSTSGTTGLPKVAAFNHTQVVEVIEDYRKVSALFIKPGSCCLNLSPMQWISGFANAASSPVVRTVKVQTSEPVTVDVIVDLINEYKPVSAVLSPSVVAQILEHDKKCDMTCFKMLMLTGSKIYKELLLKAKERVGKMGLVTEMYGQTETLGLILSPTPMSPIGSCGTFKPGVDVKLVDLDTEQEITEPNTPGEIRVKSKQIFKEYYNMPEQTANSFDEDGYLKMGDIMYKDENNYFYYMDRIKQLIKYKGYSIQPAEIEEQIYKLDDIAEVAVTSIDDPLCCELPVACVVRKPGSNITAQDIKQFVAEKMSDAKQLRGGIVFMDELPKTSTGKIARKNLRDFVKTAHRE